MLNNQEKTKKYESSKLHFYSRNTSNRFLYETDRQKVLLVKLTNIFLMEPTDNVPKPKRLIQI